MARALRAAAMCCAAAVVLSWTPRAAAQDGAATGLAGVSVMLLGSAAGGTAPSIAFPQDQTGTISIGVPRAVIGAPTPRLQPIDAPDWPAFSGMTRPAGRLSPDRYALRPEYFDSQAFDTAADCLMAASLRRLPLEVCQ